MPKQIPETIIPAVLNERQAAGYLNVSLAQLKRMRSMGSIPQPIQLSERRIGYRRADLDRWLDGLPAAALEQPEHLRGQGGRRRSEVAS